MTLTILRRSTICAGVSLMLGASVAAAMMMPSGLAHPAAGSPGQPHLANPMSAARLPHALIVKLRETAGACLSCAITQRHSIGPVVPGTQLDALNHRFGVHAARPLVATSATQPAPESRTAGLARAAAVASRFPVRAMRAPAGAIIPDFSRTYVLDVQPRLDLDSVARAYAADPAVEYCEPDRVVEVASITPNDPLFASWNSWGQGYEDLWGLRRIRAPQAWDVTRGAGVVVAVVDTGIDYTHPDIVANMWTNPGEIPNNGIDDDGNGYVDDVYGWNFADGNNDPVDDHLHGTHVAGTIAATGNNGIGVVGVAYESRVMAVRGLNRQGSGTESDLAKAIIYAVDNGADVINASWGGTGTATLLTDAIAYAHAHGVVFVAAAGNSNSDTAGFFPANDANAITVAALDHLSDRASFSNFGIKLDVAAPGGGDAPPPNVNAPYSILSLWSRPAHVLSPDDSVLSVADDYLRLAGTSMAAPHVSGTVALLLALHPTWPVETVRQALRATAYDLGAAGPDPLFGYGRVDAGQAVLAAEPLVAHIGFPVARSLIGQTSLSITGTAAGPGFVSYTLEYVSAAARNDRPTTAPTNWIPIVGPITTPVFEGTLTDWDVSSLLDGDYIVRLRVDRAGEEFVDRAPFGLRNVVIDSPERFAVLRTDAPIEIRGTVAGAGFVSYTVEYRRPALDLDTWRSDGITFPGPTTVPVRKGLLATLDVSGLTSGDRFDFRVTVVNAAGTVTKFRKGIVIDPTLQPGWPQPIAVSGWDQGYVTIANLDGGTTKEIVVGSADQVIVFEPDGLVRPGWPQSVGPGSAKAGPIVADVTGDSAPEVIATDRQHVFVWSRDGVLQPGFPRAVAAFDGSRAWLTAADLNGDGKDEILCSGPRTVEAFFGDGSVVPHWAGDVPMSDMPLAVGDVFGDGRVAMATYKGGTFRARTAGGPRSLALWDVDGLRLPGWPKHAPGGSQFAFGTGFTHLGMADLDGDGRLDVVVLQDSNQRPHGRAGFKAFSSSGKRMPLQPFLPQGQRWNRPPRFIRADGLPAYADLDRNGRAEIYSWMRINGPAEIVSYRIADPSAPSISHSASLGTTFEPRPLAIGDVDGDGEQEFVAGVEIKGPSCTLLDCDEHQLRWEGIARAVEVVHRDGTLDPHFPKPMPAWIPELPCLPNFWCSPYDDGSAPSTEAVITVGGAFLDDPRHSVPAIADLDGDGLKEVVFVSSTFGDPFGKITQATIMVWKVAGTPGPEVADWPMYRHDAKHTNVLPVVH